MRTLLWIIPVVCSCHLAAQPVFKNTLNRLDSLQKVANSLSGVERVDLQNTISFGWFGFNNARALEAAMEAYSISDKIGYDKGKAEALLYRGLYERLDGDSKKGIELMKQGIALAIKSGHTRIAGYGLVQLGNQYGAIGQDDSAMLVFSQSYQILKDSLYPAQLSSLYKNWAYYYVRRFEPETAWNYLFRSLKIREILQDPLLLTDIYLSIAEQYMAESKYTEASSFIAKAEPIISKLGDDIETVYDYKYQKAVILMRQSDFNKSLKLFSELKTHYREFTSRQGYVQLLSNIGAAHSDIGNYELSLSNFFEGLKIANESNFELERAKLSWQIGIVYFNIKQYTLAEEFAKRGLVIAEKNQYKVEYATSLNLLGLIHDATRQYDSALYFYKRALVIREEIKNPVRVASTLNNIGTVLEKQKQYKQALEFQLRSLGIERESNNPWGIASTLQALGRLYLKMGYFDKSKQSLDEAEKIALKIEAKNTLLEIYPVIIEWYELQGRLKESIVYYKKYDVLKDSVYNSSLTNRMASLQSEYTIIQKNQEIEILNKDKALRESQLEAEQGRVRQQRFVILAGLLFLVLALGGSYIVYTNYRKVTKLNRKIQENSEEIQAQSEELQVSNQMIAQINEGLEEMVEARTKELKQAYKELDTFFYRSSHDFRRPLTTFMGLAEVAKITVSDSQALGLFEKVNETARGLDKMLVKLQSISDVGSTHLIYKEIYFSEIFNSISDTFREEIKEKDIRIDTSVQVQGVFSSYPGLIKIIVENLVENSITFSQPHKTIRLKTYSTEGGVNMEIEDSGFGIEAEYIDRIFDMYFRAHERSKGNGLGLYIVKRVVEKLSGTISLTSTIGVGTVVKVFLPGQNQIGNS